MMKRAYERLCAGEVFRSISELELDRYPVKEPSELVANNPVLQAIVAKHWDKIKKVK